MLEIDEWKNGREKAQEAQEPKSLFALFGGSPVIVNPHGRRSVSQPVAVKTIELGFDGVSPHRKCLQIF